MEALTGVHIPSGPPELVLRKAEGSPLRRGQWVWKERGGLCFSLAEPPGLVIGVGIGSGHSVWVVEEKRNPNTSKAGEESHVSLVFIPSTLPLKSLTDVLVKPVLLLGRPFSFSRGFSSVAASSPATMSATSDSERNLPSDLGHPTPLHHFILYRVAISLTHHRTLGHE